MSFGVALKYGEYEVCLQSEFPRQLSLELGALSVPLFMGEWNTCPKFNESWVLSQRNGIGGCVWP